MGSGKSTWMKQIMEELGYLEGDNTVIIPSFRILQSLATQADFPSFAYYNELKGRMNEEEEI
jgi:tRNA A37 threonylcarbamoyladenosine biosynthesis protein TsaE